MRYVLYNPATDLYMKFNVDSDGFYRSDELVIGWVELSLAMCIPEDKMERLSNIIKGLPDTVYQRRLPDTVAYVPEHDFNVCDALTSLVESGVNGSIGEIQVVPVDCTWKEGIMEFHIVNVDFALAESIL